MFDLDHDRIEEARDRNAGLDWESSQRDWDEDDSGYELSDPKHPTFYDRYADAADLARKREKGE